MGSAHSAAKPVSMRIVDFFLFSTLWNRLHWNNRVRVCSSIYLSVCLSICLSVCVSLCCITYTVWINLIRVDLIDWMTMTVRLIANDRTFSVYIELQTCCMVYNIVNRMCQSCVKWSCHVLLRSPSTSGFKPTYFSRAFCGTFCCFCLTMISRWKKAALRSRTSPINRLSLVTVSYSFCSCNVCTLYTPYKQTIFGSILTFKLWGSAYTRVMPHSAWWLLVSNAHCVCAAHGVCR